MIVLLIPALLLGWLVFAFDHAPEGYQDENGFHYGRPSKFQSHIDIKSKTRQGFASTPDEHQFGIKARGVKTLAKRG